MTIEGYRYDTVEQFVGEELGVSEWVTVDQASIDRFAECTGDHQWIHVDQERAGRESPHGTTIAHGYLTLSLLPQLNYAVGTLPPDIAQALNFGLDRVRFLSPVKSGSRVRNRVMLLSVEPRGEGRLLLKTRNTVEIEAEERPAMVADALTLLIPGDQV